MAQVAVWQGRGSGLFSFQTRYFDTILSPYLYCAPLKNVVLKFKYGESRRAGEFLGKLLADYAARQLLLGHYAYITFVPMDRLRQVSRGYNQAEVLARAVARQAGIIRPSALLRKAGRRPPQEKLGRRARLTNPLGSFEVSAPEGFSGKDVLLVDDVVTTASTVNECSRVLKEKGARRVDVLTLAASPVHGKES